MSVNSFHRPDGQPPVFEQHAEERYQERVPVRNPIPIYDAYHRSLRTQIQDDCEARVYPEYDIIFVKRGKVIKTELVADYDRLTVPRAMWCDHCEKPFETDLRCPWCDAKITGSKSDGVINVVQGGGE